MLLVTTFSKEDVQLAEKENLVSFLSEITIYHTLTHGDCWVVKSKKQGSLAQYHY